MSLLDAFGRILRPSGSPEAAAVICPRCDKALDFTHDDKACASQGMTRRFLFGLLGASSAALALRLEGVPIPQAHHMVIGHPGDYVKVKATGSFSIAWDRPRNDKERKRYDEYGEIIPASDVQHFMPNEAERIYVSTGLAEMRIVSVIDQNTQKPLEFRVVRAAEVQKQRTALEKQQAEENRRQYFMGEMQRVPQGLEARLRVAEEGDYVRPQPLAYRYDRRRRDFDREGDGFVPAQGGDIRVCYRPLPGWEMVYSHVSDAYQVERLLPANLRRLSTSRWRNHPTVEAVIARERQGRRAIVPRLPA